MIYDKSKSVSQESRLNVYEAYDFLNKFLEGKNWTAGNSVTIADLSLVSSISSLNTFIPIDAQKYPNVIRWLNNVYQLPYYKVNIPGLEDFKKFIHGLMA